MLQPRLVPAFFGCETSQVSTCTYLTLHVLIGPFFQYPKVVGTCIFRFFTFFFRLMLHVEEGTVP